MVSKKYLKNVTIGSLIEHKSQITLCEYDPNWENLFSKEAEKIKTALGEATLQIEHVGSTAIPDLCAKPIIDILLVVKNSDDEHTYVKQLEETGYTLRIREPIPTTSQFVGNPLFTQTPKILSNNTGFIESPKLIPRAPT